MMRICLNWFIYLFIIFSDISTVVPSSVRLLEVIYWFTCGLFRKLLEAKYKNASAKERDHTAELIALSISRICQGFFKLTSWDVNLIYRKSARANSKFHCHYNFSINYLCVEFDRNKLRAAAWFTFYSFIHSNISAIYFLLIYSFQYREFFATTMMILFQ